MVLPMSVALVLLVIAAIALRKTQAVRSDAPNGENDESYAPSEPATFEEPLFTQSKFEPSLAEIATETQEWTL